MNITIIAGARPNFVKIAPIIHAIEKYAVKQINYRLVHTGQHYDKNMSGSFFSDLEIPNPHSNLNCGGGTQAEQTAAIMVSFERELLKYPADYVLVVGDVTSTMACAIVAKKLGIKVIHVEAGIRSGDISMPEEVNRVLTDSITDVFFTTTETASQTLINLGHSSDDIYFVGNVMIDTLLNFMPKFSKPAFWDIHNLKAKEYIVLTLHRPANVDDASHLKAMVDQIVKYKKDKQLIFPVHPRTKSIMKGSGISFDNIITVEPLGYLEFNYLVKNSLGVITDSGGITEETTVMRIPCITLRDSTERPETVSLGTNELIGTDPSSIKPYLNNMVMGQWKKGTIPALWDGSSAKRIVDILTNL